jgi:hypothetical protein
VLDVIYNKEFMMKNIMMTTVSMACALALAACGGGSSDSCVGPEFCPSPSPPGDGSTLSRADEGIWSNLNNAADTNMMQAVILSDGSYWGVAGQNFGSSQTPPALETFCVNGGMHGVASIDSNNVSGTYTSFSTFVIGDSAYSGTVSAQNMLKLTLDDPSEPMIEGPGGNFNLSYDDIYNQPASLSSIAGDYQDSLNIGCVYHPPLIIAGEPPDNIPNAPLSLAISGSTLKLNQGGNRVMTGIIAPHGTTANVFDVSLTTATIIPAYSMAGLFSGGDDVPAGTIYKGILFQTSSGILKNNIEILAAAGSSAYFYTGSK